MYETVIGLEVHVHIKTKSKAFCGCKTEFGAEPNSQVCPVCLGFPGVLPVLNKEFLKSSMKVALALGCKVQDHTKFDRKNYFYPDLPKNYQISQYDLPLSLDGKLDIEVDGKVKTIRVKRVHMEEDAGKLIHKGDCSLVDLNRTGMPLLEIVSEPDINSPDEAHEYLSSLKQIIKYLEVSDCDMEKGSLRCDANISLRKQGAKKLGVKSELKNMNSFKAVKDALNFEIKRQTKLLDSGKKVIQETRLWDEASGKTHAMRTKEEAMDYRYFPDPDLTLFSIEKADIDKAGQSLPELPKARLKRFIDEFKLPEVDAKILISEKVLADYFEDCIKEYSKEPKVVSNWLIGPVAAELNSRGLDITLLNLKPKSLIGLLGLVSEGKVSNLQAKEILTSMIDTGKEAEVIMNEKGLKQISGEDELTVLVDEAIKENEKSVADFKAGKANALMFLMGQVMKKSKGKANPKVVQEILKGRLKDV